MTRAGPVERLRLAGREAAALPPDPQDYCVRLMNSLKIPGT